MVSKINDPLAEQTATCPDCGLEESDVIATGRLGCPSCYRAFRHVLADLLPTMQLGLLHVGKRPPGPALAAINVPYPREIRELYMNEAVRQENFELAASMRDHMGVQATRRRMGDTHV